MGDFILAFLFWQWYELLGLPLRFALAPSRLTPETRRALSRLAGPVLLSFPIWLAGYKIPGSLSGPAAWILLAACLVGAWMWGWRQLAAWGVAERGAIGRMLGWEVFCEPDARKRRRKLVFQFAFEAVCFALYFGFISFRRWVPEMTSEIGASAAEKFMNQMFFWSNWHARALPAEDYWFSGHPILYYDWAHWHWAWAARVAGFPAELSLNMAFARMTLLTVEAGFLLGCALGLRRAWALGGAVAAAWFGNPHALKMAIKYVQESGKYPGPFEWSGYQFWGASRVINNNIAGKVYDRIVDEIPSFSAILGDFHAHHLALPWLVAFFALLAWGARRFGKAWLWTVIAVPLAAAATLSNSWNLPIIGFACGVWLLAILFRNPRALLRALPFAVVLGGLMVLLTRLQRQGIALPKIAPPPNAGFLERHGVMVVPDFLYSPPLELIGLWGFPLMMLGIAALTLFGGARQKLALTGRILGLIIIATIFLLGQRYTRTEAGYIDSFHPPFRFATAVLWLGAALVIYGIFSGNAARLKKTIWAAIGGCVVLGMLEVFYMKDGFGGDMVRYNSYFKFSYPVWPVLMVAGSAALALLWRAACRQKRLPLKVFQYGVAALATLIAAGGLVYPVFAMPARILQAERGDRPARRPTLNSVDYIAHRPPFSDEAELLKYIRRSIPAGDRIAEAGATGHPPLTGAYDYGARIATLTGHPVPLGWIHHENQWRGSEFFAALAERVREVDVFYQSQTSETLRTQARKLGLKWAVYGLQERKRYGRAPLDMLLRVTRLEKAILPPGDKPEQGNGYFIFDLRPLSSNEAASPRDAPG